MNKGTATNVIVILAVIAVVVGAAWFKSQRAETPADEVGQAAEPAPVATGEQSPVVNAEEPAAREPALATNEAVAQPTTAPVEESEQPVTVETLPRLVDLGADKCIPCKKLAPILDALREEYKGRLGVEFIDVWKNPAAGKPYNIRLIPTQILYDREGNEVWRHEGFISKEDLKVLFAEKVGVK